MLSAVRTQIGKRCEAIEHGVMNRCHMPWALLAMAEYDGVKHQECGGMEFFDLGCQQL